MFASCFLHRVNTLLLVRCRLPQEAKGALCVRPQFLVYQTADFVQFCCSANVKTCLLQLRSVNKRHSETKTTCDVCPVVPFHVCRRPKRK